MRYRTGGFRNGTTACEVVLPTNNSSARRLVRSAGSNACEFDVHGKMFSLLTLTKADDGRVHGERSCDTTMLLSKLRRVASPSWAFCCGLQ